MVSLSLHTKGLPVFEQDEMAECGLACLGMIAWYFGHHVDLATLRQWYPQSVRGANLKTLLRIASSLNLVARPIKVSLEELKDVRCPCILHWNMGHFVVLKEVRKSSFIIHDPSGGSKRLSWAEVSDAFTGIAVEICPSPTFERKEAQLKVYISQLLSGLRGAVSPLLQIGLLSLIGMILAFISPMFMKLCVDSVVKTHNLSLLGILFILFLAVAIFQSLTLIVRSLLVIFVGEKIMNHVGLRIFRHLIRLPFSYFERRPLSDIAFRFQSFFSLRSLVAEDCIASLIDLSVMVIALAMMAYLSPFLAMIEVASSVILASIFLATQRQRNIINEKGISAAAMENAHFLETMRGIRTIKLHQAEDIRTTSWLNKYLQVNYISSRQARQTALVSGVQEAFQECTNVGVIFLGFQQVLSEQLTIGALLSLLIYRSLFSQKSHLLIRNISGFFLKYSQLQRLTDIVHQPSEPAPLPSSESSCEFSGNIRADDLSFRYDDNSEWVFERASLSIKAGECVAIVGASGTGKSTLLKLLLGFILPTKGKILVDGFDVCSPDIRSVFLNSISVVMQDETLMTGTVASNIALFDNVPDEARIIAVAKQCGIHDEILKMPMGYRTLVGDMGAGLSGGQKQRILLARAIYRQPRILFLDEATSHLDLATEKAINDEIKMMGITRVIIAHRPDTIRLADRILRVKDKGLEEITAHEFFASGRELISIEGNLNYRETVTTVARKTDISQVPLTKDFSV